jgi:hypothetical protein
MNRTELDKAIAAKEFEYLESIAKLVADNPTVKLADLRQQYGITYYTMSRAQRMFQISRKRGVGSPAFKGRQS